MKQYTTPEQTAKLIELGFDKPKSKVLFEVGNDELGYTYSIGELIDMLPTIIDEYSVKVISGGGTWSVHYKRIFESRYDTFAKDLIDALYDMIVKLKAEGVI